MSSKHLLLLIFNVVVLAAPSLADYAKPTALGKHRRPVHVPPSHGTPPPPPGPLGYTPSQGPEAPVLTPELPEKLSQGPKSINRPIRPPRGKPKPPLPHHWDPPPFAMPQPPPPSPPLPPPRLPLLPHEPAPPVLAGGPSEKLFPGRRHLLAYASFASHGHHPAHSPVLHHGSHYGTQLPMECGEGPHMCRLPVIPTEFNV